MERQAEGSEGFRTVLAGFFMGFASSGLSFNGFRTDFAGSGTCPAACSTHFAARAIGSAAAKAAPCPAGMPQR
jgi:hypothetical protein